MGLLGHTHMFNLAAAHRRSNRQPEPDTVLVLGSHSSVILASVLS